MYIFSNTIILDHFRNTFFEKSLIFFAGAASCCVRRLLLATLVGCFMLVLKENTFVALLPFGTAGLLCLSVGVLCYKMFSPPLDSTSQSSNPQLWLDGFQGRGLALDRILDGYTSVADWPVAHFYKVGWKPP